MKGRPRPEEEEEPNSGDKVCVHHQQALVSENSAAFRGGLEINVWNATYKFPWEEAWRRHTGHSLHFFTCWELGPAVAMLASSETLKDRGPRRSFQTAPSSLALPPCPSYDHTLRLTALSQMCHLPSVVQGILVKFGTMPLRLPVSRLSERNLFFIRLLPQSLS